MLYYISKAVNQYKEFRTSWNQCGQLGFYDTMLPCYTVFHKIRRPFLNIWTESCGRLCCFLQDL